MLILLANILHECWKTLVSHRDTRWPLSPLAPACCCCCLDHCYSSHPDGGTLDGIGGYQLLFNRLSATGSFVLCLRSNAFTAAERFLSGGGGGGVVCSPVSTILPYTSYSDRLWSSNGITKILESSEKHQSKNPFKVELIVVAAVTCMPNCCYTALINIRLAFVRVKFRSVKFKWITLLTNCSDYRC